MELDMQMTLLIINKQDNYIIGWAKHQPLLEMHLKKNSNCLCGIHL
jgi:hypothetical protein